MVRVRTGEWLCKGKWLYELAGAPNWYFLKPRDAHITVRMQQAAATDIQMNEVGPGNRLPASCGDRGERLHLEGTKRPLKISGEDHDYLMDRACKMEDWDHYDHADGSSDDESVQSEGSADSAAS